MGSLTSGFKLSSLHIYTTMVNTALSSHCIGSHLIESYHQRRKKTSCVQCLEGSSILSSGSMNVVMGTFVLWWSVVTFLEYAHLSVCYWFTRKKNKLTWKKIWKQKCRILSMFGKREGQLLNLSINVVIWKQKKETNSESKNLLLDLSFFFNSGLKLFCFGTPHTNLPFTL